MMIYKSIMTIISCLFLFVANLAFANNKPSVEFFASNNTNEINLQTAYARLIGKEQSHLQNKMIHVLQKKHIEQGKFEDIFGTYRMSSDQQITADNTDRFTTSPYQDLSDEEIFSIAKELAVNLNQDSVAVLIPNQGNIDDISVRFTSHQPGINEVVDLVHNKLPALYSQAFSIRLTNTNEGFDNAKVAEIEWLGSKINPEEVQVAFPLDKINSCHGEAFLVYQDGRKEQL